MFKNLQFRTHPQIHRRDTGTDISCLFEHFLRQRKAFCFGVYLPNRGKLGREMESIESKTQRETRREERVGMGEGGEKTNFNFLKGFRTWAISP